MAPFLTLLFARAWFALTRSQAASELISECRLERAFAARARKHIAAGGTVVTVQGRGFFHQSLES